MCTSIERSNDSNSSPLSASMRCSRDSTRPARARQRDEQLELEVRSAPARLPSTVTSRASKSISSSPAKRERARRAARRLRAAEHRAHARQQLARVERLGQVVVGAELEADDLVDVVALGGEHDHRQRRQLGRARECGGRPRARRCRAASRRAAPRRSALRSSAREPALAVAGDGDVDVVLAEVLGDERARARVVVDEERRDPVGHEAIVAGAGGGSGPFTKTLPPARRAKPRRGERRIFSW